MDTRTRAYLDFKREVEDVLYEVDPYGMGSTIDAPRDEYSDEAARLLPLLVEIVNGRDVELPLSDPALRAQLVVVAERYRSALHGSGDIAAR